TAGVGGGVKIWDVSTRRAVEKGTAGSATAGVYALAASRDGRMLASAGPANGLRRGSLGAPEHPVSVGGLVSDPGPGTSSAVSADGKMLVTAGRGEAEIWAVDAGKGLRSIHQIPLHRWDNEDISLSLSPDSRTLATGASREVMFWNIKDRAKPSQIG